MRAHVLEYSGVNPDFEPVTANATNVPSFTIAVNQTTLYGSSATRLGNVSLSTHSSESSHADHLRYSRCEQSMVFAVNPTQNKTFDVFQAAAKAS